MTEERKRARKLLFWTCAIATLVGGSLWLALGRFPSVRTKVVFSVLGCGLLTLAYVELKTGVAVFRWWLVERRDEWLAYWLCVIGEIVAGILMIWFGWRL